MASTTMEQRMASLAMANQTKRIASGIKRSLSEGEMTLGQALAHPAIQNYRLRVVLGWLPRCGHTNGAKLMAKAEILPWSGDRQLKRLTQRQREALDAAEQERREAMQRRTGRA